MLYEVITGSAVKGDAVGPDFEIVDCRGRCLAPGLVDIRVQLREPGEEHKETIATGTAAAAITSGSDVTAAGSVLLTATDDATIDAVVVAATASVGVATRNNFV